MTDRTRPRIVEGATWRREWERAAPEARARVEEAVGAGRALKDPADAALAVGLAIERRKMATYGVIVAAAIAVIIIGFGTRESIGLAIAAIALLPLAGAAWAHSRRSIALKAELHNRDVVYEAAAKAAPAPPPSRPVSDPWEGLPPPQDTAAEPGVSDTDHPPEAPPDPRG